MIFRFFGGPEDGTVVDGNDPCCNWGGLPDNSSDVEGQVQVHSHPANAAIYWTAQVDPDEVVYVFDPEATNDLRTCLGMEPAIKVVPSS